MTRLVVYDFNGLSEKYKVQELTAFGDFPWP